MMLAEGGACLLVRALVVEAGDALPCMVQVTGGAVLVRAVPV